MSVKMVSESSREPGTRDASQPHLLLGSSSSVCMGKQTSDIHDREGSEIARIAYASRRCVPSQAFIPISEPSQIRSKCCAVRVIASQPAGGLGRGRAQLVCSGLTRRGTSGGRSLSRSHEGWLWRRGPVADLGLGWIQLDLDSTKVGVCSYPIDASTFKKLGTICFL
jgi:hypothetical protein